MSQLANFIFNGAKGRWVEKFSLPNSPTDNIIAVLLQSSGLGTDATLKNDLTLAAVLTHGTESTFTNTARKVLAASDIVISINTGTGVVTVDTIDLAWAAAGGALNNTLGAVVFGYRPSSGSADSAVLPLTKHDYAATTTGGNLTAAVPSIGTVT